MTISIVGAGMAGLLTGAMLRNQAHIYEAAKALPNNHHALLRFRTDDIAQYLGIPFTPVDVLKIVKPFRNQVAEALAYSIKNNGRGSLRSIKTAQGKIDQRFIAPPDFIQALAEQQHHPITFRTAVDLPLLKELREEGPIISTIPMPSLMNLLLYEDIPEFVYRHGYVVKGELEIESDLCATIYYPEPALPITRATLTGSLLQVEMTGTFDPDRWTAAAVASTVLPDFGLEGVDGKFELIQQKYAKISPIDDRQRRKFIMWATDEHGIYSVGRFAVWKTGLLLDDVFHDVQKIQSMIRNGHNYHGRLPAASQ